MKDLGYCNSWGNSVPEEIKKCTHNKNITEEGKSISKTECPECGWFYRCDSSD